MMNAPSLSGPSPSEPAELRELFDLLNLYAYREGEITLSSGRKSPHYFNGKKVLLRPEGARYFAKWALGRLDALDLRPTAVGGLELGAIPAACAVMAHAPHDIRSFIVRKERKGHGTRDLIEGDLEPGEHVIIVDDVITSGKSTLEAIRQVEDHDCKIDQIFCLVFRNEDVHPEFEDYRPLLTPCFTLRDFLQRPAPAAPG